MALPSTEMGKDVDRAGLGGQNKSSVLAMSFLGHSLGIPLETLRRDLEI